VDAFRGDLAEWTSDPFHGMYISEAEVDESLAGTLDELPDPLDGEGNPRLRRLADLFDLDAFEREALLVCLAPDLDLRYERLYAYLHDDVTRRRPTVDLLLRLLDPPPEERGAARSKLGPGGRLLGHGLLIVD